MNRNLTTSICTLALGLVMSLDAAANLGACKKEEFIDLRGNADIDGVLGDGQDGKATIAEVAVADPLGNLSTLVTAVLAADPAVLAALSDPMTRLTVFAPDDAAFARVPADVLNSIIASGAVTDVLLHHVLSGNYDPRNVWTIRALDSLASQALFVKRGRTSPMVNDSVIGCTGVKTDNGIVWLIDGVLFPQY